MDSGPTAFRVVGTRDTGPQLCPTGETRWARGKLSIRPAKIDLHDMGDPEARVEMQHPQMSLCAAM